MSLWRGSALIVTNDDTSTYSPPPSLLFQTNYPPSNPGYLQQQYPSQPLATGRVDAELILSEYGKSFWRFPLAFRLDAESEIQVTYAVNGDAALADFYLPARSQTMNTVFHSCNGFSLGVDPDNFHGCLWKDVLRHHQVQHYHVMLGGGDQIYCDMVKEVCEPIHKWAQEKHLHRKRKMRFPQEDRQQTEIFFLNHYIAWFGYGFWKGPHGQCLKPDFPKALATIPSVNIYDDHDIIDGFGSYVEATMTSEIFAGIGQVAFKYYMLFQHHTHPQENPDVEPSWISNPRPGPYIQQPSRSIYVRLGHSASFLGLDCRTERKLDRIVYPDTYKIAFSRLRAELGADKRIKHLMVMLGVPIAYPRLVWLESLLTSKIMTPIKALARHRIVAQGSLNEFDGAIEILDDLNDHWCAKTHKAERNQFVLDLQQLAKETSVRITILAGDVHLAATGHFFSAPSTGLTNTPENDHRLMLNVISSAITNTPPSSKMADFLNTRNKNHKLKPDTYENMVPMFRYDVDGTNRNNRCLLPRRNWCSITEVTDKPFPVGYKFDTSDDKDNTNDNDEVHANQANGLDQNNSAVVNPNTKVLPGPRFPPKNGAEGTFLSDSSQTPIPGGPGALSIVLHVEKDQMQANGETRPYEVIAPLLFC